MLLQYLTCDSDIRELVFFLLNIIFYLPVHDLFLFVLKGETPFRSLCAQRKLINCFSALHATNIMSL